MTSHKIGGLLSSNLTVYGVAKSRSPSLSVNEPKCWGSAVNKRGGPTLLYAHSPLSGLCFTEFPEYDEERSLRLVALEVTWSDARGGFSGGTP